MLIIWVGGRYGLCHTHFSHIMSLFQNNFHFNTQWMFFDLSFVFGFVHTFIVQQRFFLNSRSPLAQEIRVLATFNNKSWNQFNLLLPPLPHTPCPAFSVLLPVAPLHLSSPPSLHPPLYFPRQFRPLHS